MRLNVSQSGFGFGGNTGFGLNTRSDWFLSLVTQETDEREDTGSFEQDIDNLLVPSGVLPYVFSLFLSSEGDGISSSWSLFGSFGLRSRRPLPSIGSIPRAPKYGYVLLSVSTLK